jgi:hypothetical protein
MAGNPERLGSDILLDLITNVSDTFDCEELNTLNYVKLAHYLKILNLDFIII